VKPPKATTKLKNIAIIDVTTIANESVVTRLAHTGPARSELAQLNDVTRFCPALEPPSSVMANPPTRVQHRQARRTAR
jgi:hypothetical protein